MRLTLRTMLAYLDDILEPADAQELGQKIEESKFASDLVHRIRSSTRRLRLAAPRVEGKGMAADANSVAEYLDNMMPPEKVPEFEKVCLESDVHLAEVASAHQVLTLVLGKPAIIDPGMRERMYRLGQPEGEAAEPSPAPGGNGSGRATGPTARTLPDAGGSKISGEESPAVSASEAESLEPAGGTPVGLAEELAVSSSEPKRGALAKKGGSARRLPLKSMAITLLLGFAIPLVALLALGEFGPEHPVLRFFTGSGTAEPSGGDVQVANAGAATGPGATAPKEPRAGMAGGVLPSPDVAAAGDAGGVVAPGGERLPAEKSPAMESRPGADSRPAALPAAEVTTLPAPGSEKPIADIPPAAGIPSAAENPLRSSEGVPPAAAVAGSEAAPLPATPAIAPVDPFDGRPVTGVPGKVPGAEPAPILPVEPGPAVGLPASPPPLPATTTPPAPIHTGLFLSEDQVLARLDASETDWTVLAPNSPLAAGELLLSLPTYRPQVLVASRVKLTLSGEAALKLQVPDATNLPHIVFQFGRAVLMPVGEMGGSVKLEIGPRTGMLTLPDVESAAAIDARLYLPPGADPRDEPARVIVQLWATSGELEWLEPQLEPVKIAAGKVMIFEDNSDVRLVDAPSLPTWIDGRNLSDIDRRASQELRKFLTVGRPLSLSLMEQTNSRQVEVRSLACRSLCFLDNFDPALESFADEQHRSYWHAQLDAIQTRMAHHSDAAARLKAATDKLFNDQSDTVFRLIRGYSPDQLADGGAAELVEALGSPTMTIRVLANENLRRVTGRSLMYRPEARPDSEKARILRWRKLLEEGQIVYATPPSPFPPAPPAVAAPAKSLPSKPAPAKSGPAKPVPDRPAPGKSGTAKPGPGAR